MLYTNLKNVPALSAQELLLYLTNTSIAIKLVTMSGQHYFGIVLHIGKPKNSEEIVTLQIVTDKNEITTNVLHIAVAKIESIEVFNDAEAIFSLGKISQKITYKESSLLETKRHLQAFAQTILKETTVNVGIPEIELPENSHSLGRIIILTSSIQTVILDILKENDAKSSWQSTYTRISFIENDVLEVNGNNNCLEIHFPFGDIEAKEIDGEILTNKLLAVL